jgi:hypothetical protein
MDRKSLQEKMLDPEEPSHVSVSIHAEIPVSPEATATQSLIRRRTGGVQEGPAPAVPPSPGILLPESPNGARLPSPNKRFKGSALRLFGRLWNCSAEDTAIPGLCELVPNAAFFGLLLYTFAAKVFFGSEFQNVFEAYAAASLIVLGMLLLLNVLTVKQACSTVMFTENPQINTLLYLRMFIFALQLVSSVVLLLGWLTVVMKRVLQLLVW